MSTRTSSPFLAAATGQAGGRTPVWFMRQAGRSLPEYRAVRGQGSILDAIKQPELAAKLIAVGATKPGNVEAVELAAWTTVASTIFNLDETITKE